MGLRSVTTPSPKAIISDEKIQKRVSCMLQVRRMDNDY
jgi:hypothetical protein